MWARGEDKKRYCFHNRGSPYFYVPSDSIDRIEPLLKKYKKAWFAPEDEVGASMDSIDRRKVRKIHLQTHANCVPLREKLHSMNISTYEADVIYTNRFLIDSGLKAGIEWDDNNNIIPAEDFYIKPRYWIVDIESLVFTEGKIRVAGKEPIIVIGLYDSYEKKYYILYDGMGNTIIEKNALYIPCGSETLLIETFFSLITEKDPDVLLGFNLKGYDIPKLMYRARQLGLNVDAISPMPGGKVHIHRENIRIDGREILDVYEFARMLSGKELEEHNLDYVNKKLGKGRGKDHPELSFNVLWQEKPFDLLKYNKRDLDCVLEIELEQDLTRYLDTVRQIAGVFYDDILYKTSMFDTYILREAFGKIALPTRKKYEESSYLGAYVVDPVPGLYYNALILDFSSLYPNIFTTMNIDSTTFAKTGGDIVVQDTLDDGRIIKYEFDSSAPSILNAILKRLLKSRAVTKKKILEAKTTEEVDLYTSQDAAFKSIVNSAYGVMGRAGFRLYRPFTGEAVCVAGRQILKYAMNKAKEKGYHVFYGDTDSIFVSLGKDFVGDPVEEGKKLASIITEDFHKDAPKIFGNIHENTIFMSMDTVFETLCIWTKKNYLGKLKWRKGKVRKNEYDWKGMGAIRTDTSPLLKNIQEVLGKSLVDGETTEYRLQYLQALAKRLENNELTLWEYGSPRQLKKSPEEYAVEQPHVKGAKYANENFGERFKIRDKPRWVYVIPPPLPIPQTDIIAFDASTKIPDGVFQPDIAKIVKRLVQPQIDRFLVIVNETYIVPTEKLMTAPKPPKKPRAKKEKAVSKGQTQLGA